MFQKIRVENLMESIGTSIKLRGTCQYGPVVVSSTGSVLTVRINDKPIIMLPTIVPELTLPEIFSSTSNMIEWDF